MNHAPNSPETEVWTWHQLPDVRQSMLKTAKRCAISHLYSFRALDHLLLERSCNGNWSEVAAGNVT